MSFSVACPIFSRKKWLTSKNKDIQTGVGPRHVSVFMREIVKNAKYKTKIATSADKITAYNMRKSQWGKKWKKCQRALKTLLNMRLHIQLQFHTKSVWLSNYFKQFKLVSWPWRLVNIISTPFKCACITSVRAECFATLQTNSFT